MLGNLISTLFFTTLSLTVVFFVISLVACISAKRKNRIQPGSVSPEELKWKRTLLIASSVVLGVFLAVVIGLIALLYSAVAFM